ncbi:hypothetical protein [Paenibacillus sp. YIM B09110]|uniref:hypothetical protein n=1 Tax=Paenibacillus sp. YIM B09110 TaxID=3126102 RepID=UPI00301DD365
MSSIALRVPLFVSGVEPVDTSLGNGYGEGIIHADYTHSLVGTLLIAFIRRSRRRSRLCWSAFASVCATMSGKRNYHYGAR